MEYLKALQEYNGAASAIAAFLAVFLNTFSVGLAVFLYKENKRLREEGSRPNVVAYLQPAEGHITIANLIVANVGKGPAHNIKITHDASRSDLEKHKVRIRNLEIFEKWRVLPPREKFTLWFGEWPNLLSEPPLSPLNLSISYEDDDGRLFKVSYSLDPARFEGLSAINSAPFHEIAVVLGKISNEMSKWTSGFDRLKVETISTQDRQRIDEENYERALARSKARQSKKKPD